MFSTRKISTFFLGISAVSMSLLTVSFPTSAAADWPWDRTTSSQYLAAADWPWDRSVSADWPWDRGVVAADEDWPWDRAGSSQDADWPWDKSTDEVSGAATLA
jgi:hypothetical protein